MQERLSRKLQRPGFRYQSCSRSGVGSGGGHGKCGKRIGYLPLNGRNFLQLVALSPNVSYGFGAGGSTGTQGGTRSATMISVAGQRAAFNHFTLDGIENPACTASLHFLPDCMNCV